MRLTIHDLEGRTVAMVAGGLLPAGQCGFNRERAGAVSSGIPAGVCFVRLESGRAVEPRKPVLVDRR